MAWLIAIGTPPCYASLGSCPPVRLSARMACECDVKTTTLTVLTILIWRCCRVHQACLFMSCVTWQGRIYVWGGGRPGVRAALPAPSHPISAQQMHPQLRPCNCRRRKPRRCNCRHCRLASTPAVAADPINPRQSAKLVILDPAKGSVTPVEVQVRGARGGTRRLQALAWLGITHINRSSLAPAESSTYSHGACAVCIWPPAARPRQPAALWPAGPPSRTLPPHRGTVAREHVCVWRRLRGW